MLGQIHFLNTGHSDCIIIESNGHFAMIDAAEDNDYPADKPHLKLQGYEDEVVNYLLKNCKGADGLVHLDFILGTHCHSDHIGGFDTVIYNDNIVIDKAYLKPYDESNIFIVERKRWDNVEVYTQMLNAIKDKNIPLVEDLTGITDKIGNFDIAFYNGKNYKRSKKFGENINSIATLCTCGDKKFLLAGDMNYKDGDEKRVSNQIGKVDLLKVGHHGYVGSTSFHWTKKLNPDICIVPNWYKFIYPDVKFKLKNIAHSKIYATADCNGVIVVVNDDYTISVKENIM